MPPVKPHRRYFSAGRREGARATRRAILDAAHRLFVANGYPATTIRAIADEAGVAWQTVYATFGTKPAILAAVFDVAVAGDDEPVAIKDRPFSQVVLAAEDPREILRGFTRFAVAAGARTAPIAAVLTQAAPTAPEIAELVEKVDAQRLSGMGRVARALAAREALRPGMSVERATDVLWLLTGAATYRALLSGRGWTVPEVETWLGSALIDLLL